jgi:protein arginine N-methyltransferase 2
VSLASGCVSSEIHLIDFWTVVEATVRALCPKSEQTSDRGPTVLNIGFGLGIVRLEASCSILNSDRSSHLEPFTSLFHLSNSQIDSLFQLSLEPPPSRHVIIEPHPDVLAHMRSTGWFSKPGVEILEGRWQDFVTPEKIGKLLGEEGGFDAVYTDTFSESYQG